MSLQKILSCNCAAFNIIFPSKLKFKGLPFLSDDGNDDADDNNKMWSIWNYAHIKALQIQNNVDQAWHE